MGKDILMGKDANLKTILVRTGRGRDYENEVEADYVLENLNEIWRVI